MLALLKPLSTAFSSSCLLGPLFLLPKRKWGQTVACWLITAFPWFWSVLLILARKAEQHLCLMKWELHGTSSFFPKKGAENVCGAGSPDPWSTGNLAADRQQLMQGILCCRALPERHVCLALHQSTGLPSDLITFWNSNMWHFATSWVHHCNFLVCFKGCVHAALSAVKNKGQGKLCLRGVAFFYSDTLDGML